MFNCGNCRYKISKKEETRTEDNDIDGHVIHVYVQKSKQTIRRDTFLNQCMKKRLLPFIDKYHQHGNDLLLPIAHYSKSVQERFNEKNVPFVIRKDNFPNAPQARPIESLDSTQTKSV